MKQVKVYLVEDSAMLRQRLAESLSESGAGYVVGEAETEDEAIDGICASAPDAVVLDLQLRRGTGYNVLRRLSNLDVHPKPLVIVLTDCEGKEVRARTLAAGSSYFLDKASEFHRMSEVITRFAHRHDPLPTRH